MVGQDVVNPKLATPTDLESPLEMSEMTGVRAMRTVARDLLIGVPAVHKPDGRLLLSTGAAMCSGVHPEAIEQ